MAWRIYSRKDLSSLLTFLNAIEWRSVGFTSRIRESLNILWGNRTGYDILINEEKSSGIAEVREAVMLTRNGLILPLMDPSLPCTLHHNNRFNTLFSRYARRLHSIMGSSDSVAKMQSLFEKEARARIDYFLMVKELSSFNTTPIPSIPGLTIRLARFDDAPRLYELQKRYELEEVYVDPSYFDEERCRSLLKTNLRKQVVFLAEEDGEPLSKAGTNARGFHVDQLGGVFTREDKRNQGYAYWVMATLLNYLKATRASVSLFVKKTNPAALALYEKLEFETRDDFRISYFART
jgi:predicted GNAT family acetyltransferase